MKIAIELDLKPFSIPNYVLTVQPPGKREDGFKESPKFHLKELDPLVLDRLCNEFRKEVFTKAGHKDSTD